MFAGIRFITLTIINKVALIFHNNSDNIQMIFFQKVTFSSTTDVRQIFTRELSLIRGAAKAISIQDTTNFETLLAEINKLVTEAWGTTVPIQILLVTDGSLGFGPGSLRDTIRTAKRFPFSVKMNVIALCMLRS